VLKLEGQSTAEISAALGLNERRVQRRLKVTFATWREELSK
jgi:DNA-directed RNA polymerase specialized sigma24 family protein